MSDLERLSPQDFCVLLRSEGISEFCLYWDETAGRSMATHPALDGLAAFLNKDERDHDRHEGLFVQLGPETGTLQGAFVHRTCRGQAAGGVRFWSYDTVEDFLRDGMRLARGMTYKNALAGLWWGGGKGVMARGTGADASNPEVRRRVYQEYGAFMSRLRGCYVTAEDVGTSVEDMAAVFSRTRFTTCIPPELGGSGNPSVPTARGVVRGMEGALAHLGLGGLEGRSVAVQGLGHVGEPLVEFLLERGVKRIVGADVDAGRADALRSLFPDAPLDLRGVTREDDSILAEEVDVVAPCATGATLNPRTIPTIRARIVCGAANNQLEDPERDDALLLEAGVVYVPDFLVNRMGIVNCADEQAGSLDRDPNIERHLGDEWDNSVYNLTREVLRRAEESGETPHRVALRMAERRSFEENPLWGHRSVDIVRSLLEGGYGCTPPHSS